MYELFAVALTAAAHQTAPLIRSAPSPLASYGRGTRVVALDEGWTRESGIIADGASIQSGVPGCGRGLVATRDIEAGEPLISIPQQMVLCPSAYLNAIAQSGPIGAQLSAGLAPLLQTPDGQSTLLALALLHEVSLGDASRWAPYVANLPPDPDIPLLWDADRLHTVLKGSHLVQRATDLRADLLAEFASLEEQAFANERALYPPEVFTGERYLWAHAIVLSRALPIQEESSLLPLIDLANHDGASVSVLTFAASTGAVALIAGEPISRGAQVCIDYTRGEPKPTWELFFSHGFVPEPPPAVDGSEGGAASQWWRSAGGRPMQLAVLRPSDPLREQKKAVLVALGADDDVDTGVEISLLPGKPTLGAPVLRLAHLDAISNPELAAEIAGWQAKPAELWERLQRPVGAGVEQRVAQQLVDLCDAALEELPPSAAMTTAASTEDALSDPSDPSGSSDAATEAQRRERSAARVLLGERQALEDCQYYWQKVLAFSAQQLR